MENEKDGLEIVTRVGPTLNIEFGQDWSFTLGATLVTRDSNVQ